MTYKYEKHKEYIATMRKERPWFYYWLALSNRCCPSGHYAKRGIKNLLTKQDVKDLWFRDKAYKMNRPSIDRVDNKKHYEKSNCRFIEYLENIGKKSKEKWAIKYDYCVECGTSKTQHEAKGLCSVCYQREYQRKFRKKQRDIWKENK